jgi:uncharacterized membrane protein YdjX (TVP38/TMEM64 family)
MLFVQRHRGKIALLLLAAAIGGWFAYAHRADLDRDHLVDYGRGLPAGWFLAAFLILPLLGFPVSIFLVLAGIRFGLVGGMLMSALAVVAHHFAAFYLAHGWFRSPVRRRLDRAGYAIPPIRAKHRAGFTILFAALHGPPYIAKIYLLALTDIPFRIYLGFGAPVYIIFCLIPVGAGTALKHFNPMWIYGIIGLSTVLLLIGLWLRRKLAEAPADDPPRT